MSILENPGALARTEWRDAAALVDEEVAGEEAGGLEEVEEEAMLAAGLMESRPAVGGAFATDDIK